MCGHSRQNAMPGSFVDGGQHSFVVRAIKKANDNLQATFAASVPAVTPGQAEASIGGTMKALIDSVRKEEVKEHVDIGSRLKVHTACTFGSSL